MKLDVFFTPAETAGIETPHGVVVVVDVLRATSTIVEALSNGARAVFPVATADDAARIAQNVGRDSVLLCGERKALPIEGFDLGNAPPEFTRDVVEDMALVMTTTNGTRAFLAVAERWGAKTEAEGGAILAAAFLNLTAITERVASSGADAAIVCAGREGRFALEDAVCAGAIAEGLQEKADELILNDAAFASLSLAGKHARGVARMMEATAAGANLMSIGRKEDLAFCAAIDRTDVIPRYTDRKITRE